MITTAKIIAFARLQHWRRARLPEQLPLVVTNGCFDLLHAGHVSCLEQARTMGASLLVGITSDAGVRALKGDGRPIFSERDRARMIASLECVTAVCVFPQQTAIEFLTLAQPDLYVKGGDYTIDTINQDERRLLERIEVPIRILSAQAGNSTTAALSRIQRLASL